MEAPVPRGLSWDMTVLQEALSRQDYKLVMGIIEAGEAARVVPISDAAKQLGYVERHTPLLYWVARNENRRTHGRLADLTTVQFAVKAAAFLLLRVAQDVHACTQNLAVTHLCDVYGHFRDVYASKWILRWEAYERPSPATVAKLLSDELAENGNYPPPGWALHVSWKNVSILQWWDQMPLWGNPTEEQRATLLRIKDMVAETQRQVGAEFLAHLAAQPDWKTFFAAKWEPGPTVAAAAAAAAAAPAPPLLPV